MLVEIAPRVGQVYPAFHFATMEAHGLDAPVDRAAFDAVKEAEIAAIREAHAGYERKTAASTPPMAPYVTHYKRFKKTYQVLLQLESVLFKGRDIPSVGVPVEAMFLAELKHLLLGGGYDLDATTGHLRVDVSDGTQILHKPSGEQQSLAPNDLYLWDGNCVLGNVIYGPDSRTLITQASRNVVFVVYGVEGVPVADMRSQLADLASYLKTGLPTAEVDAIKVTPSQ